MRLIPEKYTVTTSLGKKKLIKRLRGDLVEYKPSMNMLSTSKFMRQHRDKSVYYGRCSGDRVQIFYHRARHRDGGSTGFFGRIEETDCGCRLTGTFRKPVYAYVSAALLVLLCAACAIGTYAGGSLKGAVFFLLLGAVGGVMMLWDNHKRRLKKYLNGLPKPDGKEK